MSEEQIGKYRILKELGKGSMGVVYLAEDPEIGRRVAIKTLRSIYLGEDATGQEALQRFSQESRSAGRLKHPNIITIFEAGRSESGSPFIVMEFVDGESLGEALARNQKFEPLEALHLLAQIASAIDHAHNSKVIHRDIKPSNVILDSSRKPFLLDFGIAKLSDTSLTPAGTVVGTPSYMAPEQIRGVGLTSATDRFAFAVLAYEMLTGVRPFPGTDFMSVANNILHSAPIRFVEGGFDLDSKFESVLSKGLSKAEADRYVSCLEFVRELGKQFDIPIDHSGVVGFRFGMTLLDLYPKQASGAQANADNRFLASDVAVSEIKKSEKVVKNPTAKKEEMKELANSFNPNAVRDGGGRGAVIALGLTFLLLLGGGTAYLLNNVTRQDTDPLSDARSSSKLQGESSLPLEAHSVIPTIESTPGCGLGVGCSITAESPPSVASSILGREESSPAAEAISLKSENPEVGIAPQFAESGMDPALLQILLNGDTPTEKLIRLIPTVGNLAYEQSGPVLLKLASHPDFKVRIAVLKAFSGSDKFRTREVFRVIVEKLDDNEYLVRGFSAKFLAALKNDAARKILSDRLKVESNSSVKKVIENALGS